MTKSQTRQLHVYHVLQKWKDKSQTLTRLSSVHSTEKSALVDLLIIFLTVSSFGIEFYEIYKSNTCSSLNHNRFESWCLHITFSHSINLNVLTAMWLTVNPQRLTLEKGSSLFEDVSLWRTCHTSQPLKLCTLNTMAQCWATSCELLDALNSYWSFRNWRKLAIYRKSWDF